ncbi:MAG TPA: DUF1028 domain-containing protein [Pseudolabrys sp.]|nr:DUF1028 domain-containing protein [Pseudolabrys sp.]
MTWSIIARDKTTGCFGIAVATKFFAAGARVPFIAAGIGAIATQALINPFYGTNGLRLLGKGMAADAVVKTLIAADDGRDHRQIHVMDAKSRVAAHTGAACIEWNGHIAGEEFSVAGNMLASARVLDETAGAYLAGEALPFPRRLIAAMVAGEAAGGDKRGKQSAALLIYGEEEWSDLDLRVDDHIEPLAELDRLERVSRERWMSFRRFLPSRRDPVGVTDRSIIEIEIARELAGEHRQ